MISDSEFYKDKVLPRRKSTQVGKWYSDDQKLEAVKCWLLTGNLSATAAALNIPRDTLKTWRHSEWWSKLVTDLRTEDSMALSSRLKKIAERSLTVVEDRLENGDWYFNKFTGQLERKGVSLKDAVTASNSLLDRALKIESKPQEDANNQAILDRLSSLKDQFERIASKNKNPIVTDVIFAEEVKTEDVQEVRGTETPDGVLEEESEEAATGPAA